MELILEALNHRGFVRYDNRVPGDPIIRYEAKTLTNDELEDLLTDYLKHLDT